MSRRALIGLATLILGAAWIHPPLAFAQPNASVSTSMPTVDAFPEISLLVSVRDESGHAMTELPAESFSVIEDDVLLSDVSVEPVLIGTRQVFVLNTSPGLRVRDSRGLTRYDHARSALIEFWQGLAPSAVGVDDLSLFTGDGLLVAHAPSAAELASTLAFTEPSFGSPASEYDVLLQALDMLADPAAVPSMASHVIYITALPTVEPELAVSNAVARAREAGVHVHPVILTSSEGPGIFSLASMEQLAESTGGELMLFDSEQGLAFILPRVIESRTQYRVTYRSQVRESGTHALQVRITSDELEAISAVQPFGLEIAPPEVVFIQPPIEIERSSQDGSSAASSLAPTSQVLRVLITFSDGHPRPIAASRLLVDGEVVDERAAAPFDEFEWDLRSYQTSSSHLIQAVVEDSQGLVSSSAELPVDVVISLPPRGLAALRPAFGTVLTALAVLAAALVLVAGLVSLSRRRAPVEETVPGRSPRLNPLKRARLQAQPADPVEAVLVPLNPAGDPVPLHGLDLVLGRDPSLAAIVLDDPSVDGMHARLIRQAGGTYLLRDQGSVAGTWVNYGLVSESGRQLEHGDLIQLGRVEFRFQLPGDPPAREIRVYPAGEDLGYHRPPEDEPS